MSGEYLLNFQQDRERHLPLPLPRECSVSVNCFESTQIQQAIVSFFKEAFYALALTGMDLSALDGVTLALDARRAACGLQKLPDGVIPLEMNERPETMELARTVAVKRGSEFKFHIVLRAGVGLLVLSSKLKEQTLACGCVAHEAAHVQHEGLLYRKFPGLYGRKLDCGDRSRQTFIKALDVWSEYAACRSSAEFRPEAIQDFDKAFCQALTSGRAASQKWIEYYRESGKAYDSFREIQQVFGDVFISAGYLLGHLHGIELCGIDEAPATRQVVQNDPPLGKLLTKLERVLHKLWLSEFAWESLEVFAPVYDLLCELMALHGMAFARDGEEWRIVMSDDL